VALREHTTQAMAAAIQAVYAELLGRKAYG
jgi:hypothetical protein